MVCKVNGVTPSSGNVKATTTTPAAKNPDTNGQVSQGKNNPQNKTFAQLWDEFKKQSAQAHALIAEIDSQTVRRDSLYAECKNLYEEAKKRHKEMEAQLLEEIEKDLEMERLTLSWLNTKLTMKDELKMLEEKTMAETEKELNAMIQADKYKNMSNIQLDYLYLKALKEGSPDLKTIKLEINKRRDAGDSFPFGFPHSGLQ